MTASKEQQTALQLAARHLVEAQEKLSEVHRVAGMVAPNTLRPSLNAMGDTLNQLGRALEAAGASAPTEGYQGTPPPAKDSLEALRRIEQSRQEGERLVPILAKALFLAEALDKRRGDWVGDMANTAHGETPGTNYAEAVQELLLRLIGELGPEDPSFGGVKGSGRE